MCHKQNWPVLSFKHITPVASMQACVRAIAGIKWRGQLNEGRCLIWHSADFWKMSNVTHYDQNFMFARRSLFDAIMWLNCDIHWKIPSRKFSKYPISELARSLRFPAEIYHRWCKLVKLASVFSCCLTFLPTAISYELKKSNLRRRNLNNQNLSFLISHLAAQVCIVSYAKYFVNF